MSPFVLVETKNYRVVMNAKRVFISGNTHLVDRHRIEVQRKDALGADSWREYEPDQESLEEIFRQFHLMLERLTKVK